MLEAMVINQEAGQGTHADSFPLGVLQQLLPRKGMTSTEGIEVAREKEGATEDTSLSSHSALSTSSQVEGRKTEMLVGSSEWMDCDQPHWKGD